MYCSRGRTMVQCSLELQKRDFFVLSRRDDTSLTLSSFLCRLSERTCSERVVSLASESACQCTLFDVCGFHFHSIFGVFSELFSRSSWLHLRGLLVVFFVILDTRLSNLQKK